MFSVSCAIVLDGDWNATLMLTNGDVTIAGQTAPGRGVSIVRQTTDSGEAGWAGVLDVEASNVVARYLRFRHGTVGYDSSVHQENTFNMVVTHDAGNIMIDHVSMSWSMDDSMGIERGASANVTFQWLRVSENANNVSTQNTMMEIDGDSTTGPYELHHSMMGPGQNRVPRLMSGPTRVINNILIPLTDDSKGTVDIGGGVSADFIGNIFSNEAGDADDVLRPWALAFGTSPEDTNLGSSDFSVFVHGNWGHGALPTDLDEDNWNKLGFIAAVGNWNWETEPPPTADRSSWGRSDPLEDLLLAIPVDAADSALEEKLLACTGASRRLDELGRWQDARDLFDLGVEQRYRNHSGFEVTTEEDDGYTAQSDRCVNDNCSTGSSKWSSVRADIDAHSSDGSWWSSSTLVPGMPDAWVTWWRTSHGEGVHPESATDQAPWNDGYDAIEHFLSGNYPAVDGSPLGGVHGGMYGADGCAGL